MQELLGENVFLADAWDVVCSVGHSIQGSEVLWKALQAAKLPPGPPISLRRRRAASRTWPEMELWLGGVSFRNNRSDPPVL